MSFCYDDPIDVEELIATKDFLNNAQQLPEDVLEKIVISVDRGVKIAAQTPEQAFNLSPKARKRIKKYKSKIKSANKKLSRQEIGSKSRERTKRNIGKQYKKKANIVQDYCHQTSHQLTKDPGKIIVMENLKTKQMTKRAKPKQDKNGKYIPNGAAQKSGLNEAILMTGWYMLELFTKYKAHRRGCCFIKISPQHSSQECANCHHIHADNRKTQANFACVNPGCGYTENADINAARVLKQRAIKLIKQYSGTELSEQGVLSPKSDIGCRARRKTSRFRPKSSGIEASKKIGAEIDSNPEAYAFMHR